MEKEKFLNKNNKILLWIFIAVTTIHVLYAAFSIRAAYMDGAPEILTILNGISDNTIRFFGFYEHTRYFSNVIMQLPVYVVSWLFVFSSKYSLAAFFSFYWFAFQLILIYWSYKLSERTKEYDTFVLGISTYSLIFLLHQIFSVVETPMTILFVLIVYNYIIAEINYTKKDKILLSLLVIILFSSQEMVLFCGPILFIVSLIKAKKEQDKSNKKTKLLVGSGMLLASVYVYFYTTSVKENTGETLRYINELVGTIPFAFKTNFLITIIGLIILLVTVLTFKSKKEIPNKNIAIYSLVIFYALFYMMRNLDTYVNPIIEGHYRVIDTFIFPLILLVLALKDIFNKKINVIMQNNILTVSILVGVALTLWQINNTYWWNKNIEYMQNILQKCESPLYVPNPNDPPISKFFENDKRNYIWHADYTALSIIFAKDYKVKTILGIYDKQYEEANATERQLLFSADDTLYMPYVSVKIKNKFWDLTEPAKALDIYNTTHNIETNK